MRLVACFLVLSLTTAGEAREPVLLHQDLLNLLQPRSLVAVGLGVGLAAASHPLDEKLEGEIGNPEPFKALMRVGNYYGSTKYGLLAVGGVWSVSRLLGLERLQPVSSAVLRALVLSNVLVSPFKFSVARERPDGSNGLSFPSGHSANSFAVTTVLARRHGWWIGVPLYSFAATVPLARVHDDKHFFSDTVGGAILGTVAGLAVTMPDADDPHWSFVPGQIDGARSLSVRWSLK
jgi:hypothetical protein